MPIGLSNAPASFQGYVNKILAEKLDIFILVYLDDILSRSVGARGPKETRLFCQSEKVSVPQGWSSIPGLHYIGPRSTNRRRKDRSGSGLAWTKVSTGHPVLRWLCQFLSSFHPGFQQNRCTTLTSMLKTSSISSGSRLCKVTDEVNDEDGVGNSSGGVGDLAKSKNTISSKFKNQNDPDCHIRIETDASD